MIGRVSFLFPSLALLSFPWITVAASAPPRKPNIVFILVDDLGWKDVGCQGNSFVETPHVDRLARDGMRFTQAYSQPACSPTRAALMTGLHPVRVGITDFLDARDARFLSPRFVALPEKLKEAGYTTGLIGKWHLMGDYHTRRGDPKFHGFDEVICSESSYIGGGYYFPPYQHMKEAAPRKQGEYLTDRLNQEAVEFIARHKDRPFFLYLSHYAVHTALAARPELVEKYKNKPGAGVPGPKSPTRNKNNPILAAMMESVDQGVGIVRESLAKAGVAESTIIVFVSDNGGEAVMRNGIGITTVAPLRGGKSWLYEGGLRVPMIVCWPGVVKSGTTCDAPVNCLDFYPTWLEVTGASPNASQPLDGESLLPLWKQTGTLKREAMFWHYPQKTTHFLGGRSAGAVRQGDFKLIEFFDTGKTELYDLALDLSETKNLAAEMPEKAAELKKRLADWRAAVGAEVLHLEWRSP